jgi:hypothetical protein
MGSAGLMETLMNPRSKKKRTTKTHITPPNASALIEPIVGFLYRSGFSKAQLLAECRSAIRAAASTNPQIHVIHVEFGKDAIDIVNRWLRDPRYLNHNGRPDELPMAGVRSVSSLVKDCRVTVSPRTALIQLLKFQIVREVAAKKYRLVRRSMDFWHADYLPFEPNFRFLVDATRAATNRLQSPKDQNKLFWQCADNSRIHPRDTKDFLNFVKQRGLSFMHEINDWLDEHERSDVKSANRRTASRRLGVGLFGIASDHE